MRSIQFYKRVDVWVQVAAIVLPWVFFALVPGWGRVFQLEHLLTSFFIVGLCQVASCLANKFRLPDHYKARSRKWYEKCLMVLLVLIPASFMLKVLLFAFVVLLYASPVLAVWYLGISIAELFKAGKPIPLIDTEIIETHL